MTKDPLGQRKIEHALSSNGVKELNRSEVF